MSADIVLATVNARYYHASLGLRYLLANLGELRERGFQLSRAGLLDDSRRAFLALNEE